MIYFIGGGKSTRSKPNLTDILGDENQKKLCYIPGTQNWKNMHGDGCKKITKIKRGVGYSTWHRQFQTASFLL